MAMAKATAFLFLLMAIPAALATQYTVGDTSGWNQGTDYTTWASGKTFAVGDSLVFNYGGLHGVDVVSKTDYDGCSSSNALQSFSDGATTIKLSQPGPMYFICPTAGHCSGGMKLAITVVAASTTPAGSPNTPATPAPSGSTTPATTGSTTPATTNTPSTTKSPSSNNNGAASVLANLNVLVLGSLVVFAFLG